MTTVTTTGPTQFHADVDSGVRFRFGRNWRSFLSVLDDARIIEAVTSLRQMLKVDNLRGKTFIDVGSGSGLFSLAARYLGARVSSFDFDPESVACAEELKRRYLPDDPEWTIAEGSVLDDDFVSPRGQFDVVYSWGVLHHTGNMWKACDNAARLVKPGGVLFIAIYNDRGLQSRLWKRVKRAYCSGPLRSLLIRTVFVPEAFVRTLVKSVYYQRNLFAQHRRNRGMSIYHDWIDWLGGLPYEYAKPEEVFDFYRERGFQLQALTTTADTGNNQFVFIRSQMPNR